MHVDLKHEHIFSPKFQHEENNKYILLHSKTI